jgi:hypothetical protein
MCWVAWGAACDALAKGIRDGGGGMVCSFTLATAVAMAVLGVVDNVGADVNFAESSTMISSDSASCCSYLFGVLEFLNFGGSQRAVAAKASLEWQVHHTHR